VTVPGSRPPADEAAVEAAGEGAVQQSAVGIEPEVDGVVIAGDREELWEPVQRSGRVVRVSR
jgi:hypothetical protein